MKVKLLAITLVILFIFSCKKEKVRKPIVHHSSVSSFDETIQISKKVLALEEKIFKKVISQDTINHYYSSPYGFWYSYNKQLKSLIPKAKSGDTVIINYEIRDVNGNMILPEEKLGSANQKNKKDRLLKIDGEDFLLGLHQGIKLMKEGEIVRFLLPSNLAFGATGLAGIIRPNQPLLIKVKLKKIVTN